MLKRIHVRYTLRCAEEDAAVARRVHEVHHDSCPVYRSISGSVDIATRLELDIESMA